MATNSTDNLTTILLESGTNEVEFLEFSIAGQHYGVNVAKVSQSLVLRNLNITSLPNSSRHVKGVVYFRNQPITVVDLGSLLGIPYSPSDGEDNRLLLVMEFNQRVNGFIIDEVKEIRRVTWGDFAPIDESIAVGGQTAVTGTIIADDRIILVIELEQLLSEIDPNSVLQVSDVAESSGYQLGREDIRIVYAEDSPLIRRFTLDRLNEVGYRSISTFGTGAQALEYIVSQQGEGIDLILSDIEMPELDGLTLCRRVKSQESLKHIPFVFYSSMINEQMAAKCMSVGGTAAFAKPDLTQMCNSLEKLCNQR